MFLVAGEPELSLKICSGSSYVNRGLDAERKLDFNSVPPSAEPRL